MNSFTKQAGGLPSGTQRGHLPTWSRFQVAFFYFKSTSYLLQVDSPPIFLSASQSLGTQAGSEVGFTDSEVGFTSRFDFEFE